jgi:hypothetical protein
LATFTPEASETSYWKAGLAAEAMDRRPAANARGAFRLREDRDSIVACAEKM